MTDKAEKTEEELEEEGSSNSGRMQAMASVSQKADEARAAEFQPIQEDAETGEVKVLPKEEAAVAAGSDKPEQSAPQEKAGEAGSTPATPEAKQEEEFESILVHGKEHKVPKSQLYEAGKRTLQMETAASEKLQRAAERERKANELLARAQNLAQGTAPRASEQDPAKESAHPQGTTPEDIDLTLDRKFYLRDAERAAKQFKADFPEIASDPVLMNHAIQLENNRLSDLTALGNPLGDPFEAYKAHGESIRAWMKRNGLLRDEKSLQEKVERKREATVVVPQASARAQTPEVPKEKTRAQILDEMRRGRRQVKE